MIIFIEQILLVTLNDDEAAQDSDDLLTRVGESVVQHAARGVIIDVGALSLVDSYMARILAGLAGMTRLLGAEPIIAGIRPEVALTMVELGIALPELATALNVDAAMANLRQRNRSQG
jgi:rsbT antagonist protein RsbS